MEWHKNKKGQIIKKKLLLLKSYLGRLGQLDCYKRWLLTESRKDNITSCKVYFNTFIFIHIKDFKTGVKTGGYKLWDNKRSFKKYVRKHPYNRITAKKEKLNVMLHEVIVRY